MLTAEELIANPELLSQVEKPLVQALAPGPFTFSDLVLSQELSLSGGVQETGQAFIPTDRLPDLLSGLATSRSDFSLCSDTKSNKILTRAKADSWKTNTKYNCCFGPEDFRETASQVPDPSQKPSQGPGSRRDRTALGQSIKRGCQFSFAAKQLYKWQDITHRSFGMLLVSAFSQSTLQSAKFPADSHLTCSSSNAAFSSRVYYSPVCSLE